MRTSASTTARRPRLSQALSAAVLTALLGLLAVPAVASAKVDGQHAAAYKNAVGELNKKYGDLARTTGKLYDVFGKHRDRMNQLLGSTDPEEQAELQDLQRRCGEIRLLTMTTQIRAGDDLTSSAERLYGTAVKKGYFSDPEDGIDFTEAIKDFIAASERFGRGLRGFQDAWGELAAADPPQATREFNAAHKKITKGGKDCVTALRGLKALE